MKFAIYNTKTNTLTQFECGVSDEIREQVVNNPHLILLKPVDKCKLVQGMHLKNNRLVAI